VCTRNDDLADVVPRVPAHRRPDLVFVQNGGVRDWLDQQGLEGCGRGLLYFAVTERFGAIQPGRTSVFTGPHAETLSVALSAFGASSEAVDDMRFRAVEFEKLLWLCLMGPLCTLTGAPVDEVARAEVARIDALCRELAPLAPGVQLDPDALSARIRDYSGSLPGYRASVKEWRWRNGWLIEASRVRQHPTPLHLEVLRQAGCDP